MTAYPALELLLVAAIVGAAAWHLYRRWRGRPAASGSGVSCRACDQCAPQDDPAGAGPASAAITSAGRGAGSCG